LPREGEVSGLAAQAATNTIPIVVLSGADPRSGLAASFSRPGGNVTGVAQLVTAAEQKRFELLHELVPDASIAYLINPTWPNMEERTRALASREAALGTNVSILKASSDRDLPAAFDAAAQNGLGALLVSADPFFFMKRDQLVALAAARAIPTMYFFREFAAAGGLMSYGTKLTDGYHQLGVYTGRILKGAKPDELPIAQQSEKIELVINLKTAKALGTRVPPSLLVRADEVIE
jgi:putative tryptophan/tyrosine transport system substrate-binding protein